jgi:hypothetical protein
MANKMQVFKLLLLIIVLILDICLLSSLLLGDGLPEFMFIESFERIDHFSSDDNWIVEDIYVLDYKWLLAIILLHAWCFKPSILK